MFDGKAFGEEMVEVVRSYVDEATGPLLKRIEAQDHEIAELKKRAPANGDPGQDGADGKDGRDGKDAEPVSDEQIAAALEAYIAANPPADGVDGENGADGKDVDMDVVMARVDEFLKSIPVPENGKDGRDGVDGKDGAAGEKGIDGRNGSDGADGIGVAGALIDRDGILNLTLTNGEVRALGRVEGRDGKDGERGVQGFGLDDFATDWRPEEKVLVLSWDAGDTRYSHELFVPYLRDAGVWVEGSAYLKGDCVTWAGSLWTAQDDTSEKPETGKGWRLAVKRGRDGKAA